MRSLSAHRGSSIRVQALQCGVDVDEDYDHQVENGPNDAQHGQDALLLTFLVLDSLFLITVDSVYHFPWKSLQFSPQTNLERADKKHTKTQSMFKLLQLVNFVSLEMDVAQCVVNSDNGNKPTRLERWGNKIIQMHLWKLPIAMLLCFNFKWILLIAWKAAWQYHTHAALARTKLLKLMKENPQTTIIWV